MVATVIVPCRRAEMFAPAMAAQLAAQRFDGEWEAVFVDDEAERPAPWRDAVEARGFIVVESRSRGASAARNAGLDAARGEIVLFADVDDGISPDWVATMVEGARDVDLAWGGATVRSPDGAEWYAGADGRGEILEGSAVRDFVWRRCLGYRLRDLPKALLPGGLWKNCGRELGSVCWRAFRRSVIGGLRFPEGLRNGEDSVFLCAYAKRARAMRIIGATGYVYRMRGDGSLMTENTDRRLRLEGKFALRAARRAVDPRMTHWRGTFLLSVLETLGLGGPGAALRYICGRGCPRLAKR